MKPKVMLIFSLVSILLLTTGAGALTANGTNNGWQQVNQSGFGSADNETIAALRTIDGYLYAGVANQEDGAQIWRLDENDNWVSLMDDGFGEDYNIGVFDLVQFNGKIYAGTFGGEIWRSQNGDSWNRVVTGGFGLRFGLFTWDYGFSIHPVLGASHLASLSIHQGKQAQKEIQ